MKRFTMGLIFTAALSSTAIAQTPPEVLKHYKTYRTAKADGDKDTAYKSAKRAWKEAERILGDHKMTGDLAFNFAQTSPKFMDYNRKDFEARMEAYDRAIQLSNFHEDLAIDVELERLIKRAEFGLSETIVNGTHVKAGGKTTYLKKVEAALVRYNLMGSTFEGDLEVLRARRHDLRAEFDEAIEAVNRAEKIYGDADDNILSPYPIMMKLFRGNSYIGSEKPILAALDYQDVMQNLEDKLPSDHVIVKTAFRKWMQVRSNLEDNGRLAEAEEKGLCECWPFEDYKNKPVAIKSEIPKMPSRAKRSGHVNIMFDLTDDGKPINLRTITLTDKVFEEPALESVRNSIYGSATEESDPSKRKDITTKITFRLSDRSGRVIPEDNVRSIR